MVQLIIVYIIIGIAIGYSVYLVVRSVRHKSDSQCASGCGGCNGCDLKHHITHHRIKGRHDRKLHFHGFR